MVEDVRERELVCRVIIFALGAVLWLYAFILSSALLSLIGSVLIVPLALVPVWTWDMRQRYKALWRLLWRRVEPDDLRAPVEDVCASCGHRVLGFSEIYCICEVCNEHGFTAIRVDDAGAPKFVESPRPVVDWIEDEGRLIDVEVFNERRAGNVSRGAERRETLPPALGVEGERAPLDTGRAE